MVGSLWRIGDGSKVKVWRDNWIPKNEIFKVISVRGGHDQKALVSEFIDHDLGIWKRNMLNSYFESWEEKYETRQLLPFLSCPSRVYPTCFLGVFICKSCLAFFPPGSSRSS